MKYIITAALIALMSSCAQNPFHLNYRGRFANYSVTPNEIIITPHDSDK